METKSTFIIILLLLTACSQPTQTYTAQNMALEGYNLTYEENTLSYTVRTSTPTPCYNVTHETTVGNSFNITVYAIPQTVDFCTQVIDYKEVTGNITTPRPSTIHIRSQGSTVINEKIDWQPTN